LKVQHETDFRVPGEAKLASKEVAIENGQEVSIEVELSGQQVTATIGSVKLTATDETFADGCVALLADVPTCFLDLQVYCTPKEQTRIADAKQAWLAEEKAAAQEQPRMKLWRKILTPQFGADRNIRFGDLNNDGQLDILIGQIYHRGPTDSNSELGCMTAIDLQGNILWQLGRPDRWQNHLTNDTPFQIHDIDHDGKSEVIYCQNFELKIAEGATGKTLRSVPTPDNESTRVPFNRYPKVLGDSLLVADFKGQGFRGDIVLKDRYLQTWAFDNQLNLLWQIQCNTGHFPFPRDTDGDGREELTIGYSRWSPDGKQIWSHDDQFKDHADSVAVFDLDRDGKLETLWGASDEGFVLLNSEGVPRLHLRLGHVQNLTIAELRTDSPGYEVVTANFWKNQGLIHILDQRGNIMADFEPRPEHGSAIVPVHWKGDGCELILIGPDPIHGGLYDGYGHRVVSFPADGHPTKAYDALDLIGDTRDEIIVWDAQEIWIYTASDQPMNLVPPPIRNSRSNESNYRARISIPSKFQDDR
jgi:rhamnogalacturonan endolyase